MKIGICGQMCSGKTSIANYIISKDNSYYITSFAKKLKEIAETLFNMKEKNRDLLINIGTKMREINPDVWVNYTINEIKKDDCDKIIIDDIRFLNEFQRLKENNWTLIKLIISEDLQLERLKKTYPFTWEIHLKNVEDESKNINNIPNELFDLVIEINNKNEYLVNEKILHFLKI
jgi:hypothetical protein